MALVRNISVRLGLIAVLMAAMASVLAPVAAADELPAPTEYDMVYSTAVAHLGNQWKLRGVGPTRFDCSGLVWYAFHSNSLQDRIGGYRSVSGYVKWFAERGLVSKTDPQVGDLVVWGANQHVGIYIGNGMAISTLVTRRGVAIHPVTGYLNIPFKTYLHTTLTRPPLV
jgi:cell wall-associated NlpC family hydrolase